MKIAEFPPAELSGHLRSGNLLLALTPFVARIRSDIPFLARDIAAMYADFEALPEESFADFHVEVSRRGGGIRQWIKPQARFYFDGRPAFIPLPLHQAFAMLEWGLNWCVAAHSHQYLIIHAAVIEKQGLAAILPAPPGSGKSTLCAGLISRGWRLLSDELGLYDMDSGLIYGMSRPVNLKNASIDIIRRFAPQSLLTQPVHDTSKGSVSLMRPPTDSVRRVAEPARPAWIVLPNYTPDAPPRMEAHSRAHTFMLLAEQSFNYDIHGLRGFEEIGRLIDQCRCYRFTYGDLNEAEPAFGALLAERGP